MDAAAALNLIGCQSDHHLAEKADFSLYQSEADAKPPNPCRLDWQAQKLARFSEDGFRRSRNVQSIPINVLKTVHETKDRRLPTLRRSFPVFMLAYDELPIARDDVDLNE